MKTVRYNLHNKWKTSPVCVLVLAAFLLLCAPGLGAEPSALAPSAPEQQLLGLINQARTSPLLMAEMVGLDKEAVLECFADRRDILENGLPPLSVNQKLGQTASAHTEEMLAHQYYDNVSANGKSPEERIIDAGYNPLATGERIGIIGFRNFMDAEQAVWELFRNMFRDELACGTNQDWHILNPEFSEIGLSVRPGTMAFGGNQTNIYITTYDFGASSTGQYAAKRFLLQAVNQVRNDPAAALAALGMDFETAARSMGRNGWILLVGLPPMAPNEELFSYADQDIAGLPAPGEAVELEVPDVTVTDAVDPLYQDLDYSAQQAVRVSATAFLGNQPPDPVEAIVKLLEQILKTEILNPDNAGALLVLHPDYTEAGIGYELVKAGNAEGTEEYYGKLTLVLSQPSKPRTRVVGRIAWKNPEERLSGAAALEQSPESGEQAALDSANGLKVRIEAVPAAEDLQTVSSVCFTDPAGGYSLVLPVLESQVAYYQGTVSRPWGSVENQPLHSGAFSYYHKRNLLMDIFLEKDEAPN